MAVGSQGTPRPFLRAPSSGVRVSGVPLSAVHVALRQQRPTVSLRPRHPSRRPGATRWLGRVPLPRLALGAPVAFAPSYKPVSKPSRSWKAQIAGISMLSRRGFGWRKTSLDSAQDAQNSGSSLSAFRCARKVTVNTARVYRRAPICGRGAIYRQETRL